MNVGEAVKPILGSLVGFLKIAALFGTPVVLVGFFCWFMFLRWSQHGVDL